MDAHGDEQQFDRRDSRSKLCDEIAADFEATDESIDPIQSLLNQRHPRIRLRRETLNLLQRVGGINQHQSVHDFCNEAIRYVVLSREAGMATLTDLHAASAALDARLDELSVILLRLHQSMADLSLLVEQDRIIGAFGERLKKLTDK